METNLLVETREHGDWTVVDVKGEVDLYTAPQLRERLVGLVESGRTRLAVNMEGVEFLDSTGLGVLIGALKRVREREGILAMAAPREPVRKVLSITGLDKVFRIHESVEQATAS